MTLIFFGHFKIISVNDRKMTEKKTRLMVTWRNQPFKVFAWCIVNVQCLVTTCHIIYIYWNQVVLKSWPVGTLCTY